MVINNTPTRASKRQVCVGKANLVIQAGSWTSLWRDRSTDRPGNTISSTANDNGLSQRSSTNW